MPPKIDEVGNKYGLLTVVGDAGRGSVGGCCSPTLCDGGFGCAHFCDKEE